MSKVIMIQGTMSNAGKSLITAGLCRIFRQDGYRVAPFKSQNMALNSFITKDGLEMGRAQVMQAEAACTEPDVCMNPVLLKPTGDIRSQVIVNGEVVGNMDAREYFVYKKKLMPEILKAFKKLEEKADIIVIEGAGSPAEINLKENDIVNMGLAKVLRAPVLLVGDIDRGGVFAQLLGTLMLLDEDERKLVKGLIVNKFRGDKAILDPGVKMLEEKAGIPVAGVVPYAKLNLDDEDSLTERFERKAADLIDIAVICYPRISNFTDMNIFEQIDGVSVRYVRSAKELSSPDMIVLPGSKNTLGDLKWLRESGLEAAVIRLSKQVREGRFSPCLVTDKSSGRIIDFSAIDIKQYEDMAEVTRYDTMNSLVDAFYYKRDMHERMRQKSADLTKLLNNHIERTAKKLGILERTLRDAENRDKYKIYGDLLTANIYRLEDGMKSIEVDNYYDPENKPVKIALDPSLSHLHG